MQLSSDITSEDLDVFLQEAEEQLQLLDESFVRMEQAGNDPQILQEIFRAAHTIKGSAGMVGHQQMTQLAHSMENLLDQVRNGSLEVSTPPGRRPAAQLGFATDNERCLGRPRVRQPGYSG